LDFERNPYGELRSFRSGRQSFDGLTRIFRDFDGYSFGDERLFGLCHAELHSGRNKCHGHGHPHVRGDRNESSHTVFDYY
jgi:hypothetical protein